MIIIIIMIINMIIKIIMIILYNHNKSTKTFNKNHKTLFSTISISKCSKALQKLFKKNTMCDNIMQAVDFLFTQINLQRQS